ncbi:MAG: yqkA1 [Parcubacteria group bacterium]|nr:yqkA1 [Parcubacteria group bacterium]
MHKTIGLKRNSVSLVKHNPAWKIEFQKDKIRLQKALGNAAKSIEHIGSTAVPGLHAKPIIDILVGAEHITKRYKSYIKILERAGYIHRPLSSKKGIHIVLVRGNDTTRTHHIHVVKYKGAVWKRLTLFRDYLIAHSGKAKEYEALKGNLARKFPNERRMYTKAKGEFIRKTVALAHK